MADQMKWTRFRAAIIAERGAKCEHCGSTLEQLRERFPNCTNQLQLARKDKTADRFNPANVELLCQACHERAMRAAMQAM